MDVQPDGRALPAGPARAFIGRFHEPGAGAGNDGISFLGEIIGDVLAVLIIFVVLREPG